jgi:hypothetical protein
MKVPDPELRPARRLPGWAWGLPAALALGAILLSYVASRLEVDARAARQVAIRRAAPEGSTARVPGYAGGAAELLAERNALWPAALSRLERVLPADAQVASFEFAAMQGSVRVEVLARDQAKLTSLAARLEEPDSAQGGRLRWALRSIVSEEQGHRAVLEVHLAR